MKAYRAEKEENVDSLQVHLFNMFGKGTSRHIKAEQSGSPESDCSHKNKKIKNLKS